MGDAGPATAEMLDTDHHRWREDSAATAVEKDVESEEEEHDDSVDDAAPIGQQRRPDADDGALTRTVSTRTDTSTGKTIIGFLPGDPGNPYEWSSVKKVYIVVVGVLTVLNSTIGSALPASDTDQISLHFNVYNDQEIVLPISMFLLGYVLGPLLFGPLSESYGRQYIMIGTFLGFTVFALANCLAPNWPAFVIFRLIQGVFASSPISVTGGMYADLYSSPVSRGRAMSAFMGATMWGPVVAPIASGYLSVYGWRWPFWFGLIFACACLPFVLLLPETYGPVILQRRARKMRKQDPDNNFNVYAPIDLESSTWHDIFVTVLGRPFRMIFTEMLVGLTCLYMSLIYGVFYILLVAFPEIYPPIYGFSLGEQGLAFLGLSVGVMIAVLVYLWWDRTLRRANAQGKPWASVEEYRRLPLACIGGPFFAIGLFWIGWAARPSVHWIVPILGGVPFGFGYVILFMGLLNYIIDAYAVFAASGLAASAFSRSLFGCVLPFATTPMYQNLGIAWACSLLGFISLGMCLIPFLFIRFGSTIRAKSTMCQELAKLMKDRQEKEERRLRRMQRKTGDAGADPEKTA